MIKENAVEGNKSKATKYAIVLAFMIIMMILTMVIAVAKGSTFIEYSTVYKAIINKISLGNIFANEISDMNMSIIWEIRLPRVILGAVCGAGLSLCGVLMQCMTKNPISDPYILGISSGASCGAVAIIVLGGLSSLGIATVSMGAFVGSIVSGIIVFAIGTQMGKDSSTTRLILSGMAVSTIFSAATNMMIYGAKNANQAKNALFWTVGSLGGARWDNLLIPTISLFIVFVISIVMSKTLDIMLFGDDNAIILGVNVKFIKGIILISSALLTSVLVSVAGTIGFVGLVVPHVCRIFCGSDHKKLILLSTVVGATLLMISDILARGLFPPMDIPIGIITSLIGGPFFLYLIHKKNYSFGGKE